MAEDRVSDEARSSFEVAATRAERRTLISQEPPSFSRDNVFMRNSEVSENHRVLGVDDYVTKPFSLEELVARIRTILRRAGLTEPDSGRMVFEDIELDEETREVSRQGEPIELTATEYRLLHYLMLNPRRVLTRTQI